jgi:predicted RNA binding protein YcfA (HicA-like mRNA interferase family)
MLVYVNSRDILAALVLAGWKVVRVRGDHHQLAHPTKSGIVTVPHPRKDIPLGTLTSIEKQSGVSLRPKPHKKKK